jgi:hypothetical protein
MKSDSVTRVMSKLPKTIAILVLVAAPATVLCLVLCDCGRTVDTDGSGADAAPASDPQMQPPASTDAGNGLRLADGAIAEDATIDAAPPVVSCGDDAAVCDDLPSSTCADPKTVLYYGMGSCVDGGCVWSTSTMACGFQSACVNGGCTPPTTK